MKGCQLMSNVNFASLAKKKLPPPFVPDNQSLNCDPTYELEEMIVEARPLHKKKKRLLRHQSNQMMMQQQQLEEEATVRETI
jgi:hypothetical protein